MESNVPTRKDVLETAKYIRQLKKNNIPEKGFRVLITGKGGAGKTTTTALLSHIFAMQNYRVLAVDEDPQMNLPYALGLPPEKSSQIVPLTQNPEYIEEKTGAQPGSGWGLMLRLNPEVEDVVNRFGIEVSERIQLLVMGTVVQAATGCLCPENSLLDAVVHHINLREKEIILMDTQAGVEHFGRAIAKGFQQVIILTDATFNAVQVALHSARLADSLGIPSRHLVINRVQSDKDVRKVMDYIQTSEEGLFTNIFKLPFTPKLYEIEPQVAPILRNGFAPQLLKSLLGISETIAKYGVQ